MQSTLQKIEGYKIRRNSRSTSLTSLRKFTEEGLKTSAANPSESVRGRGKMNKVFPDHYFEIGFL